MRRALRSIGLLIGLLAAGANVYAHHGRGNRYDLDNEIAIQGTVRELVWRNPHIAIAIDVEGEDGEPVAWVIEHSMVLYDPVHCTAPYVAETLLQAKAYRADHLLRLARSLLGRYKPHVRADECDPAVPRRRLLILEQLVRGLEPGDRGKMRPSVTNFRYYCIESQPWVRTAEAGLGQV